MLRFRAKRGATSHLSDGDDEGEDSEDFVLGLPLGPPQVIMDSRLQPIDEDGFVTAPRHGGGFAESPGHEDDHLLDDALLLDTPEEGAPVEERDPVYAYVEEEELKDIERQIHDIFDELKDLEVTITSMSEAVICLGFYK